MTDSDKKLAEVQEWYAKETNREVKELDDYDLLVCRVAEAYHEAKTKSRITTHKVGIPLSDAWYAEIDERPSSTITDTDIETWISNELGDTTNYYAAFISAKAMRDGKIRHIEK